MLALNQDALGRQAVRVATIGAVDVYAKDLEDGAKAVGFFNRDSNSQTVTFTRLEADLGLTGSQHVRDLWRQQDLADVGPKVPLKTAIPAHGVMLYKLIAVH